jgi:hypothetical protein
LLAATLVVVAGCGSSGPLDVDAGSSGGGGLAAAGRVGGEAGASAGGGAGGRAGASAGGGAGADVDAGCPDPYAQSSQPDDPCAVDSDCQSNFLACRPTTVDVCRDANDGALPAACVPPALANVPVCPTTAPVTLGLCAVRYQLPCTVDSDCGPAGFSCSSGSCQQDSGGPCETDTDCLIGWSCYVPCPCPSPPSTEPPQPPQPPQQASCEPPFATFACPACPAP